MAREWYGYGLLRGVFNRRGIFMNRAYLILSGVLALAAAPASAIVYSVNVGNSTLGAVGFIKTDGTIGTIAQSNIVDWEFALADNGSRFFLDGPSNSGLLLAGTGMTATATGLFFNFSGSGFALFQNPAPGSGINFICFAGQLCGGASNRISITVDTFGDGIPQQGVVQIGFAGGGGVIPEPATWAMMIAGFGLVGGALRRRRPVAATA
jgi:hypothetical protein